MANRPSWAETNPISIIMNLKNFELDSAPRGNPFPAVCKTFEQTFACHSRENAFFTGRILRDGSTRLYTNLLPSCLDADNMMPGPDCPSIGSIYSSEYVENGIDRGRRPEWGGGGLIWSMVCWSAILVSWRRCERKVADQRILGGGDFARQVVSGLDDPVKKDLRLSEQRGDY